MLPYLEKGMLYILAFLGCLFSYEFYDSVKDMQKVVQATNEEVVIMRAERKMFVDKFDSDMTALTRDKERIGDIEDRALFFAGIEQEQGANGIILKVNIPSGMVVGVNGNLKVRSKS